MKFTNAPWGINTKKLISKGMWEMKRRITTSGGPETPPIAATEVAAEIGEVEVKIPLTKEKAEAIMKEAPKKKASKKTVTTKKVK